jgi:hypothetical protein
MVKIPSLDELRKMGSDIMNSAKNVDVSGVVDKIKNRVETVSEKFSGTQGSSVKHSLDRVNAGLNELMTFAPNEINAIKKIQADVAELQQRIEAALSAANQTTNESGEKKQ